MTPAGQTAEQLFECASRSVPVARRFLTARLEEWSQDALLWDGQQIVTELVANAVLHAAGAELTVRLMLLDLGALRIEVVDGGARLPRVRRYGADASTGRGLALVADLARAWGVDRLPDGKVVWCEIAPEATAERSEERSDVSRPIGEHAAHATVAVLAPAHAALLARVA